MQENKRTSYINQLKQLISDKSPATSFFQLWAHDLHIKPQIDGAVRLEVYDIDSPQTAAEVKRYLLKFYSPNTEVQFYRITEEKAIRRTILLSDLDCCPEYGKYCGITIEGNDGFDKKTYTFGDLIRIMERLSAPDGCPWDLAQTHKSIKANMLEEAGEAVAAIDAGDTQNLIEELGDVMLQSVFHADIARRQNEFEMCDVISVLCRKLYTRHTHVFGGQKAADAEEALNSWQQAKAVEKANKQQ